MDNDFLATISETFDVHGGDANQYSPLTLAFIGDAVYGLVVKTVVVESANCPANTLNAKSVKYVKASAQAAIAKIISDSLTEEESNILRRGRNAKSPTMAKNATMADYRLATGLEALVGYLYLKGENKRLIELMRQGMEGYDCIR